MPDEKIYTLFAYGEEHKIVLRKGHYQNNKVLAIEMVEVFDDGYEESWHMLTVNLVNEDDANDSDCSYVDVNNLGNSIITWLAHNNIGQPVGLFGFSGYCCYPLFKFNKDVLASMVEL